MRNIRYPTMRQSSISDCGASCLYMILKYYGGFETLENLKKLTHTTKEGTSLFYLKEAANFLGFDATGLKASIKDLKENKFSPFIAHVLIDDNYYHYVVVYKIKRNKFWVADPSSGYIKILTEESFKKIYQESILILSPKRPLTCNHKNAPNFLKWFFHMLKKEKKIIKKLSFLSFLITFLEIITVSSYYVFIKISKEKNIHLLILFSIFLILCILVKNLIKRKRNDEIAQYEKQATFSLKKEFWMNIFSLPYREIERKCTGELLMKVEEVNKLNAFLLQTIFFFCFDFLTFIFIFIFILYFKKMTFFFIGYCVFEFLFQTYLVKKEKEAILHIRKLEIEERQKETETIESIISIKKLNLENNIKASLEEKTQKFIEEKKQKEKYLFKCHFHHDNFSQIYLLLTLTSGTFLIIKGSLLIEDFLIINYLFSSIGEIFKNLLALLTEKEEIKWILEGFIPLENHIEKQYQIKKIEFKQASFSSYGNLKNISLILKQNCPVLLIGKSGIGKSTLARAIKGYHVIKGRYINDELKEEVEDYIQKRVTYVSSDSYLYTDTLKENIIMKRNIDSSKLKTILEITHVQEIINENPNLFLYENGTNLSSGQKQKIALARALLNEFDVLILDEALNKIDEEEEKIMMENIVKIYKNKIILVISHRKNLNSLFSKIVLFTNHGQLKKVKRKEILCSEDFLDK